jgi:hypothetical protein
MEQTGCSETSAYKIQTPGNYPEESIQQAINKYVYENIYPPLICCPEALAVNALTPEAHFPTLYSSAVVLLTTIDQRVYVCVSQ